MNLPEILKKEKIDFQLFFESTFTFRVGKHCRSVRRATGGIENIFG